jgi:hypothetical protein
LAVAVTTAVVVELTVPLAVAVKVVEVDPDEMFTAEGTDSAELLSKTATDWPPLGAAALNVTVQVAEPGAVNEDGLQLRLLTVGAAC